MRRDELPCLEVSPLESLEVTMPTQKQIEASNLYSAMMEEIKVRIQFIETAIQGRYFMPHGQLVREVSYLQLRLICEMIALSCLVVHGDIKSTQEKRFMKEYDATKIIAGLQDLHPNFYPLPVSATESMATPDGSKGWTLTPIPNGFLTKGDLFNLYGKTGSYVHRGSIKKLLKAKMPIEHAYTDVWNWLKKIGKLLSSHQIALLDGKTWFVCYLSAAAAGGRCQVAIAEGALEKPPSIVGSGV
jgi:hypothetical protein